jgi:putative endonuclease
MTLRDPRNRDLGRKGERLALDFLKRKGYRIIETNYRTRRGEIDIICEDKECLVFVEVKTRRSLSFGRPEEAVNSRKRSRMLNTASRYLVERSRTGKTDCRFDVITILEDRQRRITHIQDAFRP